MAVLEAFIRRFDGTIYADLARARLDELRRAQTAVVAPPVLPAPPDPVATAVKNNSETLFNSPRQVVLGNPAGDVTMVEFFDYNCGYCRRALEDMLTLIKTDPRLRIVLKEFPVLGQGSVEAAQAATAVRLQDKTGSKYLDFHRKLLTMRGEVGRARALAAARSVGLDIARLERDMAGEEARASLEESLKLAEALGLNGTPSYVIGNKTVIGAVGLTALREKVNSARCGKPNC
jgi:protein-disulfide isomerase